MPVLQVRLTNEERVRVMASASAHGLSVSAWVKRMILQPEVPDRLPAPPPTRSPALPRMSRTRVNPPPTTKPPAILAPPPPRSPVVVEFHPVPKPGSKKR